jgi:ubiquinone/menaquinone biosynthesis C-methylase UbiE
VRRVLELGSGGGHDAVHLKERVAMTLTDISQEVCRVAVRYLTESIRRGLRPASSH